MRISGEPGRGERVGVVSGAVHRLWPDGDQDTVEGRGDLQVHARVADLRREQVRYVVPVPGGTHGAVDQYGSPPDEFAGIRHERGEDVTDDRAQHPDTLRRVCAKAAEGGVAIGAQVGYRDLAGFGRRAIDVPPSSLTNEVIYQIGALDAFARLAGTRVRYVKPHGALYNRIVHDEAQAAAVVAAVQAYDPSLPVLGLPGSAWLRLAAEAGLTTVREAFADRGYTSSATLVPRSQPGALITEADVVAKRVLRMITDGVVQSVDGSDVDVAAQSVCVHGDSPDAVGMARRIREAILDRGITLEAFA